MSALLRSAKFLRLFSGVVRNSSAGSRNEGSLNGVHRQVWHGLNNRLLSSQPEPSVATPEVGAPGGDQSLEKVLQRIDLDARRWGRVHRSDVDEVFSEVKSKSVISSSQGLMLLRCCGSLICEELPSDRTKLAQNIWDTMKSIGVKFDVSHYNALLRVYLENGHDFSPTDFLSYVYSDGIEPNRVTFQRLIYRYCLMGDINGATQILNHMKSNGMAINEDVFNSLIIGHARAHDLESAKSMLSVMRQTSLEPSPETFRQLACAHVACGDLDGVQAVMQMARDASTPLTPRDMLELVYSMTAAGQQQRALEFLEELKDVRFHSLDCAGVLARLIYDDQYEMAYKVLGIMTRANKDNLSKGFTNFFVRYLVRKNPSPELIVEYCERLKNDYNNDEALSFALYRALNAPISLPLVHHLLKTLHQQNVTIRQHFMWPLIACARNSGNYDDLLQVIRMMVELDVFVGVDTLIEQVFPTAEHFQVSGPKLLADLDRLGVRYGHTVHSLCRYYLLNNRTSDAIDTAKRFSSSNMNHHLLTIPLAKAYVATHDLSLIELVHRMFSSSQRSSADREMLDGEQPAEESAPQVMAGFVLSLMREMNSEQLPNLIVPMLQSMLNWGLMVDASCAAEVQSYLSECSSPCSEQICHLLEKLSDESLVLKPLESAVHKKGTSHSSSLVVPELLVSKAREQGSDLAAPLTELFLKMLAAGQFERTPPVLQELESLQSPLPFNVLESWCTHTITAGRLEEATTAFRKLTASHPDQLCDVLTLKLARLMLSKGLAEDAVKLLSDQPRDSSSPEFRSNDDNYRRCCWRLVNVPAEAGDPALVQKLLDLLHDCGYVSTQRRSLLSMLVKANIVRDDLAAAVESIEKLGAELSFMPGRSLLMKHLVKEEKSDLLQRVVDLSNRINGEMDTLYELAIAFIQCGRVRQAQTVMQTPGFRLQERRLDAECEALVAYGRLQQLEQLVHVTRHVYGVDRRRLYEHLLRAHCDTRGEQAAHAGLAVWTRMQEEDVVPSDDMLCRLAFKLQRHGIPVPFDVPTKSVANFSSASFQTWSQLGLKTRLRNSISQKNADDALAIIERIRAKDMPMPVFDLSRLIDLLLSLGRLPEALALTEDMLTYNAFPLVSVLRRMLTAMSEAGMVEQMRKLEANMQEDVKALVNMSSRISSACIMNGDGEKQLADMERLCLLLESGRVQPSETLFQFPQAVFFSLFETMPEVIDRCTSLVERLSKLGINGPLNSYWSFLMINEKYDEARKLYDEHFRDKKILYRHVLSKAIKSNNKELVLKLLEFLKGSNQPQSVLMPVLQCLLKISTKVGGLEETQRLFDELGVSMETLRSANRPE